MSIKIHLERGEITSDIKIDLNELQEKVAAARESTGFLGIRGTPPVMINIDKIISITITKEGGTE